MPLSDALLESLGALSETGPDLGIKHAKLAKLLEADLEAALTALKAESEAVRSTDAQPNGTASSSPPSSEQTELQSASGSPSADRPAIEWKRNTLRSGDSTDCSGKSASSAIPFPAAQSSSGESRGASSRIRAMSTCSSSTASGLDAKPAMGTKSRSWWSTMGKAATEEGSKGISAVRRLLLGSWPSSLPGRLALIVSTPTRAKPLREGVYPCSPIRFEAN